MREITEAFEIANLSKSAEPIVVFKIENSEGTIYASTHDLTIDDSGSIQLLSLVESASYASQDITPEDGISTIGSASLTILDQDLALTNQLNVINDANESIFNDRVEIYFGYQGMDFDDFTLWQPMWVDSFSNDDISYTINLKDTQRITKDTLFEDLTETTLDGSYGFDDTDELQLVSTDGLKMVEHDANWREDASTTIGYLEVSGEDLEGDDATEVISYTGIDADGITLTGVERGKFGTTRVNLSSTDDDGDYQEVTVTEFVYLCLPVPKMIIALLTGELYGQTGATLPSSWSEEMDSDLLNVTSFENIGNGLWDEIIEFRKPDSDDLKGFLSDYCTAYYGVYLKIDQYGRFALARYDYQSQQGAADVVITNDETYSISDVDRSADEIINDFKIYWSYDFVNDEYLRTYTYKDANSIDQYKYKSEQKEIYMLGLRNGSSTSVVTLDYIVQSQIKRLANAQVTRTLTGPIRDLIQLEVGDTVQLIQDYEIDYRTLETYSDTFEVQQVSVDFLSGECTLSLFASEGVPSSFDLSDAVNSQTSVVTIDHTGWTDLATTSYGTESGGVFTFTDGADIPAGYYYYNGDLLFANGTTVTINEGVYFDCLGFEAEANATIDGSGRGVIGDGYFGGADAAQYGLDLAGPQLSLGANGRSTYDYEVTSVDIADVIRINDGDDITGIIPTTLQGTSGGIGGSTSTASGGAAASGGAGLFVSCTSFIYQSSSKINLSGSDNNVGDVYTNTYPNNQDYVTDYDHAGAGGFGFPGVCVVAMKDPDAAQPFLYDIVEAKTGAFNESSSVTGDDRYVSDTASADKTDSSDYRPKIQAAAANAEVDYASASNKSAIKVFWLATSEETTESDPDIITTAAAPTLGYVEYVNTPTSATGDISTVELTAGGTDDSFSYAMFWYKEDSQTVWTQIDASTSTKATQQITSDGLTYQFKATAYNSAGTAGGTTTIERTITNVVYSTSDSAGESTDDVDEALTIPNITGLELTNPISTDFDDYNLFKSGDASFTWNKSSITASSSATSLSGDLDQYFKCYNIRIEDTGGNILREQQVFDNAYTYTYDYNKADNDGAPIREFVIFVNAEATTGYVTDDSSMQVENPEPSLDGVVVSTSYDSIVITFTYPDDVDFVGAYAYIAEGAGVDPYTAGSSSIVTGNTITFSGLTAGHTYSIGLAAYDQFGIGEQVDSFEVSTDKIQSTALGDITSTITIDEDNGLLVTNNSGYLAFHGAIDAPDESDNPLIFGAYSGTDYPFWIDSGGNFKFGIGDNSISFDGSDLQLGAGVSIGNNDDRTITVGATGDYSTLNDALVALSKVVPAYKDGGFTATIECQSGYVDTDTHEIDGLNLGWITITSATGTLSVSLPSYTDWMTVTNGATSPLIDCNITTTSVRRVFYAIGGSINISDSLTFTGDDTGILFASLNNGVITSDDATVSNFSYVAQAGSDSGYGGGNINMNRCSVSDVYVVVRADYSSNVTMINCSATNVSAVGITVNSNSRVSALNFELLGTKPDTGAYVNFTGILDITNASMTGCSDNGVYSSGGIVNITDADITSTSGNDIYVNGDAVLIGTQSSGDLVRDVLVAGSVPIMRDGYDGSDETYSAYAGDELLSRFVTFAAGGTITIWADFAGNSDRDVYVKRNGTTVATFLSVYNGDASTTISVDAGQTVWLQSDTSSDGPLILSRWQIRTSTITDIQYIV